MAFCIQLDRRYAGAPLLGTIPAPPVTIPGPVLDLAASVIGYDTATLSWHPPAVGNPEAYEAAVSRDNGTSWQPGVVTIGSTTITAAFIELVPETPYIARVRATNGRGPGEWTTLDLTTAEAPRPPGVAENLAAYGVRRDRFAVAWTVPESGGTPTSASVRHRPAGSGGAWTVVTVGGYGGVVTGLTAGTAYEWQVQLINAAGTAAWSASQSATTAAPFAVPSVPGLADWRNLMESVEAARRNHVTGATLAVAGAPTMTPQGIRLRGGTDYLVGVSETATMTVYVAGKLLVDPSSNASRPVFVGSFAANSDPGYSVYPSGGTIAAADMTLVTGHSNDGGATALVRTARPVAASTGNDMRGITILRAQTQDGANRSMWDITHGLMPAPSSETTPRKLSASQPLRYGSSYSTTNTGECVMACVVVVGGAPSESQEAAILAAMRAEMAYWGVAEGA